MDSNGKLMNMLTGYAASHQHPFNIFVHMIGIPTIMFGILIPLTWVSVAFISVELNLAHVAILGFFLFYLTLDTLFAVVFLAVGLLIGELAAAVGELALARSASIAAAAFVGGYIAQFIGHAVEKSMPVLVRHPLQANLAAPFFTVVEIFKILGLRDDLFNKVQREVAVRRQGGQARESS